MSPRRAVALASALTLAWLVLAACLMGDYGPTWDVVLGEYPHGEQYLAALASGDAAYLDWSGDGPRPVVRQPHVAFPQPWYEWHWTHPFGGILSALCCRVFWSALGWRDSLQAHDLPAVLAVAALLFVLVRRAGRRWGATAALATGLALLLSPQFFAHGFNNIKDVPEACLYVLAVLAFVDALSVQERGGRSLPRYALAGALTGLALATKPNAWFVPIQCVLWWGCVAVVRRRRGVARPPVPWQGVLVSLPAFAAAYLAVSPMLWTDTLARFSEHLAYFLDEGFQGYVHDKLDGVRAFWGTTPPALMGLALVGLLARRLSAEDRCLLALGIALPVGRTLLPGAINLDGVRHFLEFQPFLALAAGVGAAEIVGRVLSLRWMGGLGRGHVARAGVAAAVLALLFAAPARAVIATHPNGVCYHNALVGGLAGAQASARDASVRPSDYWGNSCWQGLDWIGAHAEPGACLHVSVAPHVVAAAAPLKLRADVRLGLPLKGPAPAVVYVMYIVRPAFYDDITRHLDAAGAPVHQIVVQGAPILKILRIAEPAAVAELLQRWRDRSGAGFAAQRLAAWARGQPPAVVQRLDRLVDRAPKRGLQMSLSDMRVLLPPELHDDALTVLTDALRAAGR